MNSQYEKSYDPLQESEDMQDMQELSEEELGQATGGRITVVTPDPPEKDEPITNHFYICLTCGKSFLIYGDEPEQVACPVCGGTRFR